MTKPIQQLIDAVSMTPIEGARAPDVGGLYATHRGVLELGGLSLPVFRLNDGRAVISEEGIATFLRFLEGA